MASAVSAMPATASAQIFQLKPSLAGQLTFTDNVALTADRRSDWVLEITPSLAVVEKGAHTSLHGTISLPALLYARTGGSDSVRPTVDLGATAELYPRLLFVDAAVQVSQQYVSPFGARSTALANATNNRYTAQSYSVSPYIKGEGRYDLSYELRDTNTWSNATNANVAGGIGDRAYTNEIIGKLNRAPKPLGFGADYDRLDTRFTGQDSLITELERLSALWQPDPQWELSASAGYEDNRYPLAHFSGAIYGAGVKWRPTARTSIDAKWEHRFFGGSYHFAFDHRTALTAWSLHADRDITSYPQQIANLPAQGDVSALLNSLFASRIADPVARQTVVDQLIRDRGLPASLVSPLSIFSQQITLQQSVVGTVTLLGARNSVLVRAFRTRSEPVVSALLGIGDLLTSAQTNNTQTGSNVIWTHQITPLYTLATNVYWVTTRANDASGQDSRQGGLQAVLSIPLSTLTQAFAGARHQRFLLSGEDSFDENAVFVGINHHFR